MGKLLTFFTILLCSVATFYGQCADEQTFTVCDMTVVDGDSNGDPDGIINLYDELSTITGTTITPADGMWFDPGFNFALDVVTGDLFLWDLPNSSEALDDYQFQLLDASSGCPDDVTALFNIVIGPYSGTAASTVGDEVNLQVCQSAPPAECGATTMIDLFQILLANPSPHMNGDWSYMGTSPNFVGIISGRFLSVNIPYVPGPPLVDEETFELEYRVPGITPCSPEEITTVKVSVVKEPFAGFANSFTICETELLAGDFDMDIDLRDDAYLVNENIEGTWDFDEDETGQLSGPGDSIINLRQIYDNLVATNPQFGCQTYEFTYQVESRSTVCMDQESTISFTFYEYIRPFTQDTTPEFCVDDTTTTTANLYDYIAFSNEGGTEFDYPNNSCTNWTFISGPSDLGLISNTGIICSVLEDPDYTSQGTIDLSSLTDNTMAGTYVFEFTVSESYHCNATPEVIYDAPDGCDSTTNSAHPCESQTTQVVIIINPTNYAGEDTADLEFCETEGPLVLTDLLETNGIDDPVYLGAEGTWTDLADGSTVDNNYTIPEITTDSQVFNFEYNTTTTDGCTDSATLTFTAYQQFDPGENGPLVICSDGGEVDLFTLLGGAPDTNGTWTGPGGFATTDNIALFDPATGVEGEYNYTVPANITCPAASATVMVTVEDALYAGEDTTGVEICENLITVDLTTLLETNGTDVIDTSGEWTDTSGAAVVNPFTIPVITGSQTFELIYTTTADNSCEDMATLTFIIFEQFSAGEDSTESICDDSTAINLFDLLGGTPDINGTWTGPNGYSTTDNNAPFDPTTDAPGDYLYTVPANGACEAATATVLITLLEGDYAGENTTDVEACDSPGSLDLITLLDTNGTDTVVAGGVWTDDSGTMITNPFTIPAITGSQVFDFTYTTTSANGCTNGATLSLIIFEQSDAGTGGLVEICMDGTAINLFDELSGSPDTSGAWSGPNGYSTTDNNAPFTPMTDAEGDYVYTTPANGACEEATATVTVSFFETAYAGEDTVGAETCDISGTIDLTTLLDTNGTDAVSTTGVWTDTASGDVISNPFTIPTINGSLSLNFTYKTSTANGCLDESTLSFTIFESGDAGTGISFETCVDQATFNLFDLLSGTPDTDGTWSGPDGYSANGTAATVNPATDVIGDYVYTVAANGACEAVTSIIAVTLSTLSNAGGNVQTIICPGDYTQSLFDLLGTGANTNGVFTDLATGDTVPGGFVEIAVLGPGSFSYDYIVSNGSCSSDSSTIDFTITLVSAPSITLEQYCVNDGVTLGDLNVTGANNFVWYAFAEAEDPLPLSTLLLAGQVYFLAAVDDNGCQSERIQYVANILPLSDGECGAGITTGVSDNDDGTNDFLELGSLPTVFPDFDIQIFNRYGTIVYRGDRNTPLFNGSSNTGSGLGDQLPTGVYFYIFYPNTEDAEPIDGNFYLSR